MNSRAHERSLKTQILHVLYRTLMNAVDIAGRRRLIFKYRALELTPAEMRVLISEKYSVSIDTIRRDLRLMTDWLPGMLSLQEDEADESLYRLVGLVQMAQRQLAKLSFSADNDNARVGASKALAAIACKEIELRQDLGRIPRMPISIQHTEFVDLEGLDLDERAIAAIVQNFMDDEARRLRMNEDEEGEEDVPPVEDAHAQQNMVEPFVSSGNTVVEPVENCSFSQTITPLGVVTAPRPHEQGTGCDSCRLWNKSCAGPQDGDLDDMGKCIHIQPWIRNGIRGLSV